MLAGCYTTVKHSKNNALLAGSIKSFLDLMSHNMTRIRRKVSLLEEISKERVLYTGIKAVAVGKSEIWRT